LLPSGLNGGISPKNAGVADNRGVQAEHKGRMQPVGVTRTKPKAEISEQLKQGKW
jgi:hypothetical protein